MRRLSLPLLALVVVTALAACGVTADDRAAVVGSRSVSTETVDAVARDSTFLQSATEGNDSIVAGSAARTALTFGIQIAALQDLATRFGAEVTSEDRSQAQQRTEQQVQGAKVSATAKRLLEEFYANAAAISRTLSSLKSTDPAAMKKLYDAAPVLWDQVCGAIVVAQPSSRAEIEKLLADGSSLEQLAQSGQSSSSTDPTSSQGPLVQRYPDESPCQPRALLPKAVRDQLDSVPIGQTVGPVAVDLGGEQLAVWFRVDSIDQVTFEQAAPQLDELVSSFGGQGSGLSRYFSAYLASHTTVNPRYGRDIDVGGAVAVIPPQAPKGAQVPTTVPTGSESGGTAP